VWLWLVVVGKRYAIILGGVKTGGVAISFFLGPFVVPFQPAKRRKPRAVSGAAPHVGYYAIVHDSCEILEPRARYSRTRPARPSHNSPAICVVAKRKTKGSLCV
jgi:hypothetical protein